MSIGVSYFFGGSSTYYYSWRALDAAGNPNRDRAIRDVRGVLTHIAGRSYQDASGVLRGNAEETPYEDIKSSQNFPCCTAVAIAAR
jgi:hypothetical protein